MAPTSLLVCADAEAVQVLSRVVRDLGIEVESCSDSHLARSRIENRHFDALILDCVDEPAALRLIAYARSSSSNQATVVVVMVSGQNQVTDIFAKGANFALYKPISSERAAHSIRAARGLIRQERRIHPRIPVCCPASAAHAGREEAAAMLVDLNEDGLCFQTGDRLPPSCKIYFQFALPENNAIIRLAGEVMWQDSSGRVGIRFVQVPQASRKVLATWVQSHSSLETGPGTRSQGSQKDGDSGLSLSAGLRLMAVSAGDRRDISRQACRLGAEVYKAGSNVPLRCALSDVSNGGCYIEASETLAAAGMALEIVVRTGDLKFCIAGTVQSVHPGFGMGVKFSLHDDDQKIQVRQLLACAQPESKLIG